MPISGTVNVGDRSVPCSLSESAPLNAHPPATVTGAWQSGAMRSPQFTGASPNAQPLAVQPSNVPRSNVHVAPAGAGFAASLACAAARSHSALVPSARAIVRAVSWPRRNVFTAVPMIPCGSWYAYARRELFTTPNSA